ncbi:MAG: hypothetical protein M1132_12845 [Chloroflexi bacterium]|nr:hypothetical protein [Chloroflexota bacterium]
MVTSTGDYARSIDRLNPRTPRIEALLRRFFESKVHICPERSHLATQSWKESEGYPLDIRRAMLFAKICDEIPIAIFDRELIVGSQTHYFRGVGLQLDYNPIVGFELEEGDRRLRAEQAEGILSEKDLQTIIEDSLYWRGKSPGETMWQSIREILGPSFEQATYSCTQSYGKFTNFAPDADYAKVLETGLGGIMAEIEAEMAALDFSSPEDGRKYVFLQAAHLSCQAAIRLARRYARLAWEMATREDDARRKQELETIAAVCERVPEYPARSFWEALQCVRLIHLALYLEDGNGAGALLGRLDQNLYPFYRADIDQGVLEREQAAELLAAFWLKVAATDRIPPGYVKTAGAGYVQTRAILGGVDRKGNDACNELTYLILHVAGELKLDVPLYLRWHSQMSREIMLKAVWTNIEVGSEPAFHNDEQIIPGLVADGVALEDARDYVLHGCSHPFPYGSCYGTVFFVNGGKVLELVMNNGVDPKTGQPIGLATGAPREFTSIRDWVEAFARQWEHLYDTVIHGFNIGEITQMQVYSQPFASAIIADCIHKGLDVHAGGCRYNQFIGDIQNKVYADIPDALVAIDELVYTQHKLTVADLLEACAGNFYGEKGEYIRRLLEAAPKFGNDLGKPEAIYRQLNDHAVSVSRSRKGYFGFPKRDTRVGGAVHMAQGRDVGALPNGRKSGMPLSDGGISPVAGCDTRGPTITLRSVARALDFKTNRSSVLNQKMPRALLRTQDERKRLVDLIESYFAGYNGYQVQWNIQDRDFYLAAKANPSEYKNLIVRVGGYSAYFVELDPELQDQIIARTEQRI